MTYKEYQKISDAHDEVEFNLKKATDEMNRYLDKGVFSPGWKSQWSENIIAYIINGE